jgi:hypothetical protein
MVRGKINKTKLFITLSPLLVLLAIVGLACFLWTLNVVLIRNESGLTIDEFTLTVCGKSYTLENVPHGETEKFHFTVHGDSSFQMRATLPNGTVLSNNFGYVTSGAGAYHNRITVTVRSNLIEGTQQ